MTHRQDHFLDPEPSSVLARLAGFPLLPRRPMQGNGLGPAPQPASRLERRVRRVSQVRAGRRPAAARLAGLRPIGPVLRQGVRGRHQPAVLPRPRHQRLDGFWLDRRQQARIRAADRRGARATWPLQQGDAVGLSCVAEGIVRNIPPRRNPSHLMSRLRRPRADPAARSKRRSCRFCTSWPRRSPSGHWSSSSRTCSSSPTCCGRASSTCGSASTTRPSFTCSTRRSSGFDFRRPMRFLDMEGGPSIFAEPNEIADRYHKATRRIPRGPAPGRPGVGRRLPPESRSTRDYEQVLIRFLVGRTRCEGVR